MAADMAACYMYTMMPITSDIINTLRMPLQECRVLAYYACCKNTWTKFNMYVHNYTINVIHNNTYTQICMHTHILQLIHYNYVTFVFSWGSLNNL